eukprot:GHVS01003941.1.p1 GENE.GHVS01003941.1~~GHVS01003941.1.p1  ORF type:complete len:368 (-),score=68.23 GHVS01003941.1:3-1106(-)
MEKSAELVEVEKLLASEKSVEEQMEQERKKREQHLQMLQNMEEQTAAKLFHELTDTFFAYLAVEQFAGQQLDKLEFFHFVVGKVKAKLNPLRVGQLLKLCCEKMEGSAALAFICAHEACLFVDKEAELMCKAFKSYHFTRSGNFKESEKLLDEVQHDLSNELGLDLSVSAYFHRASAELYQASGKLNEYYQHAILYLSYTSLNSIPADDRVQLAYDISMAAVVADTTYNFGELLQLPLIGELKNSSSKSWVYELLVALNEGRWDLFDKAFQTHNSSIMDSVLRDNIDMVKQKITLLAMMELAFRKPKKHRKLTFVEIAEHCRIQIKEVLILFQAWAVFFCTYYIYTCSIYTILHVRRKPRDYLSTCD